MPYPTVPDLVPFQPSVTPNLMTDGPYDHALTAIEDYLRQLGEYVDARFDEIRDTITNVNARIDTIEQNHMAVVDALNAVTYGNTYHLFDGLTASGGTVVSPALTNINDSLTEVAEMLSFINGKITKDQASITELHDKMSTVSQWQTNASSGVSQTIPVAIDTDTNGVKVVESRFKPFDSMGNLKADLTQTLWNAIAQLYLAAPGDDQTKLLGYLGNNSDDIHTADIASLRPKPSAALTAGATSGLNLREVELEGGGTFNQLYDGDDPVTNLALMDETGKAMSCLAAGQGAEPIDKTAAVLAVVLTDDGECKGGVSALSFTDGTPAECSYVGTPGKTPLTESDLKRLGTINNVVTIDTRPV